MLPTGPILAMLRTQTSRQVQVSGNLGSYGELGGSGPPP